MEKQLLNSQSDGNNVYYAPTNNISRSRIDTSSDIVKSVQHDSIFNYVDVLKNGTITPEQIGRFHNLGLDFIMTYKDFKRYNITSKRRIEASIINNLGIINNNHSFEYFYENLNDELNKKLEKYLRIDSNATYQAMYTDRLINFSQLHYLKTAFNILESSMLTSTSASILNTDYINNKFETLISTLNTDTTLTKKQIFNLESTLSIMKYSAAYWNNYIVTLANPYSTGTVKNSNRHSSGKKIPPVIPCCGRGITGPCALCDGGDGNSGGDTDCKQCETAGIIALIIADGLTFLIIDATDIVALATTTVASIISTIFRIPINTQPAVDQELYLLWTGITTAISVSHSTVQLICPGC